RRGGGARVGAAPRRRADQPHGGGARRAVALAARRGAGGVSPAPPEQAGRRPARCRRARPLPLRRGGLPARPRGDHRLLLAPAPPPATALGRRVVRRHDARFGGLIHALTLAPSPLAPPSLKLRRTRGGGLVRRSPPGEGGLG